MLYLNYKHNGKDKQMENLLFLIDTLTQGIHDKKVPFSFLKDKKITKIYNGDALVMALENGTILVLGKCDGHSRYQTIAIDGDINDIINVQILEIKEKETREKETGKYRYNVAQFVDITTNKGCITLHFHSDDGTYIGKPELFIYHKD